MNSPMLDVHLIAGQSSSFTRRIEEGSLDGAIMCRAPGALEPHMSWWPLYLEKMIFIVPRNSLFELACDPLDQLRTAPFIQFDRQIWTGALVQQVLNQCDVRPRRHLELNSSEAIIELVRQGFGVAIVPMLAKVNWADDQYMKILPLPGGGVQRQVGLLERTHHHRKRLTEALRSYFEGLRPSP
jgi:DNA-binding transcriptional LysR family regulator